MKKEASIYTEFGLIPSDWILCTFKDVLTTFSSGATPYRAIAEYYKGPINWISSGELNYNVIEGSIEHISESALVNTNLKIHRPGTFLMAITGLEAAGTRGRCAIMGVSSTTNQSCMAINGTERLCVEYLFNFYKRWGDYLAFKYCQGSKQQSYTAEIVKKLPIIFPPTRHEQRAIAEVLSDIDSLIEAIDKKIAKKRAIKEGAMQQLLTGRRRLSCLSEDWIERKLGDIAMMNSGGTPTSSNTLYYNGNIPFLAISDISTSGRFITNTEKSITELGLLNSSARMFPSGTIMYAMYATLGKCSIAKIDLSCSQAILGISPNKYIIDATFLYYLLSSKEKEITEHGQTGTQSNLSKTIIENLNIVFPPDIKEQSIIAQILTDIDDEIEQLEKQRAKYTVLKQGAMQKLLTGEIRLAKAAAQPQKSAEIRTIPVSAHIVGGHIVNKLHDSKGWGRTKLQKSIHLVGYCCQLDFGNEYIRNTAGPDDQKLMSHIDSKFKLYRHVDIQTTIDNNGRKHYNYIPTSMIDEVEQAFENYPAETQKAANDLLAKIWKMDLARAEIVSTLYAVWNNRIIKKQPINNTLLLEDFYDWSDHKADFSQDLVLRALSYMNKEGIIPVGWGKYIDKK